MQKTIIFMIIVALVLTVLTLQNPHTAQMKFMGWQSSQIPIVIIIIGSISFGAIVAMLMGLKQTIDSKKTIRRLENEIKLVNLDIETSELSEKTSGISEIEDLEEIAKGSLKKSEKVLT